MPTFKNNTSRYIDHSAFIQTPEGESRRILVRFAPDEERELPFWLPYQKLGLTLISADYPVVPNTILISGTFDFDEDMERKFDIESCDTYIVNIIVQSGRVVMYTGNSNIGVEVAEDAEVPYHYKATLDWEFAPYLRFVGKKDGTKVTIHAEINREPLLNTKGGSRIWL